MENPYSLVFGKMPGNYIDRELELNEIIETYLEQEPSIRAYLLQVFVAAGKQLRCHLWKNIFGSGKISLLFL